MKLRQYQLPSNRETHEGWAIFVLDLDMGYFSVVSDFGNYAYIWSSIGGMDFRKFLIGLETDYLRGKLMMGRENAGRAYDADGTKGAVLEFLKETGATQDEIEDAKHQSFEHPIAFHEWVTNFEGDYDISEVYGLQVYVPNPECTGFCERVMPRFKALLQAELDSEKKPWPTTPT